MDNNTELVEDPEEFDYYWDDDEFNETDIYNEGPSSNLDWDDSDWDEYEEVF